MVQKGPSDDAFENFIKDLSGEEKTSQTAPQVPVENSDKPQEKLEEAMNDPLAGLFEWSDEKVDVNGSKSADNKPAEINSTTEQVAQPEVDLEYELSSILDVAPIQNSEDKQLEEKEDKEFLDSLADTPSEEKPAEQNDEDSLGLSDILGGEDTPGHTDNGFDDLLDSLSDISSDSTEQKPEQVPTPVVANTSDEDDLISALSDLGSKEPVETKPTPKIIYEPGQERVAPEQNFVESEQDFDESEKMPDELSDILNGQYYPEEEGSQVDATVSPQSEQELAQSNTVEHIAGKEIEMPEDLFLNSTKSKPVQTEVTQTEQAPVQTVNNPIQEVTSEKPNQIKRVPYISFDDVGGKGRFALYCGGALLIGALAFYSAPYLDSFVNKYIEPHSKIITQFDNQQPKTKKDSNTEIGTTDKTVTTQSSSKEGITTPEFKNEEQNKIETPSEQKTTTEKPSLKELFHRRYHK
ncbi:hypothetical protein HZA97_01205 [Candidatus Woesearchaeota archaeon]|nr:hypothetical protein [Candidatus Woesearchaeota archaeon]